MLKKFILSGRDSQHFKGALIFLKNTEVNGFPKPTNEVTDVKLLIRITKASC